MVIWGVKTTVELPDGLFRQAKARAAERGQSLKDFFTEALQDKIKNRGEAKHAEPSWAGGFGGLRRLRKETAHIQKVIDETFGVVEIEDRD